MIRILIKKPIITEKTVDLAKNYNTYVFEVDRNLNKHQIKKVIEELYNVKVKEVRIVNLKERRRGISKYQNVRPRMKKAYIKLETGYKINVFPE